MSLTELGFRIDASQMRNAWLFTSFILLGNIHGMTPIWLVVLVVWGTCFLELGAFLHKWYDNKEIENE